MIQKSKKSTQNREYGVFANYRNPKKPHTPYWAEASGRLWKFAVTSLKIEELVRSLESELKIIPDLGILTASSLGWKFFAIVNLKFKGGLLNLPKPQKLYWLRILERFGRISVTPEKIEKLVRSPLPSQIIIGVLFLVASDRSQKIKVKAGLKSSPLNNLLPWMLFRGEQIIAKDQNLHNACWKGAWLRLWEFRCNPPKLKRSLFYGVKNIPDLGNFGGWEVAA